MKGAYIHLALANLRFPGTREESVGLAEDATAEAGREGAGSDCWLFCGGRD